MCFCFTKTLARGELPLDPLRSEEGNHGEATARREEERRRRTVAGVTGDGGRGGGTPVSGPRVRASRWERTCAGGGWGSGWRMAAERRLGSGGAAGAEPDRGESQSNGTGDERGSVAGPAGTREAVERVGELVARTPGGGGGVMVVKMSASGRSFGGVADYCLHDRWVPGQGHPESAERVEWTETRNLATEQGDRAARIMAATAEAAPELKRLAGAAATGRKLEKPVCHYSLNWAKEEKPVPARDAAGRRRGA